MQPKVSVVIPVYNVEKYLRECLDSVVNQTLKDIEIICVDDGSTDNSGQILSEYAEKDKRIKVIHKENSGAGDSRNIGFAIAKGEYVIFFDSDDYMLPIALKKLIERAKSTSADVTICRSLSCVDDAKELNSLTYALKTSLVDNKEIFSPFDISDKIFQFCVGWPWDKLYKRSFVEKQGLQFQNLRHSNDTCFVLSSLALAEKIALLQTELVVHRKHAASLEHTSNKKPDCFYYALLELYKILSEKEVYHTYKHSFINYCCSFSLWHLNTLEDDNSKKIIIKNILKLLKKINFSKYDKNYFYSKSEYSQIKNIYKSKSYNKCYLSSIEKIFSVKNTRDKKHKVVTILGLKLKFKRRKICLKYQ